MKNMDKGLTVTKWVLIVLLKIPQMPENLSAQFVCPSPNVLDFNGKRLHWVSVVRSPCPIPSVFVLVVVVLLFSSQYVQSYSFFFTFYSSN